MEALPRGLGVEDAAQRAFPCGSRQIKNLLTSHSLGGGLFLAPQGATMLQGIWLGGKLGLPGLARRGVPQEWKRALPKEIGRQGVGAKCSRVTGENNRQVRE